MDIDNTSVIYNGGISTSVNAIVWFSRRHLDNPYRGYQGSIYSILKQIKESYETIPFDIIQEVKKFSPLSSIKDLLPEFEMHINDVVENSKREAIQYLIDIASAITNYERQYFKNLDLLLARQKISE